MLPPPPLLLSTGALLDFFDLDFRFLAVDLVLIVFSFREVGGFGVQVQTNQMPGSRWVFPATGGVIGYL